LPLLIVLLTWLSLRAVGTIPERSDQAMGEIEHLAMAEAGLHRNQQTRRPAARLRSAGARNRRNERVARRRVAGRSGFMMRLLIIEDRLT
jgi:hypothetical protein